jgi:hypothetical protein
VIACLAPLANRLCFILKQPACISISATHFL